MKTLVLFVGGVFLLALLSAPTVLAQETASEGWEVEVPEQGAHSGHSHEGHDPHAADELPTEQITVWRNGYEIFLEHARAVAGTPSSFVVHVTELEAAVPRREGPIEFVLKKGDDSPVTHSAKTPAREGIYLEDLVFPQPGEWAGEIRIPDQGAISSIKLPLIHVYPSEEDAHHAPAPEEPEGISFLKETQWKFPFKTEVWNVGDSTAFLPESACLTVGDRTLVYVQISGELFQAREVAPGKRENGRVEIVSGLTQGDRVVTRGAEVVHLFANTERDPHEGHGHGDGHGESHEQGAVEVTPKMREALGIASELVCQGDFVVTLDLYGWVRARPSDVSDLTAPIAGVVQEIHIQPGDSVEKGSPLLSLVSSDFLDWQKGLLAAARETSAIADKIRLLESEGKARVVELLGGLKVAAAEKERIEIELGLIEGAGQGSVALREIRTKQGELKAASAQLQAKRSLALAYGVLPENLDALLGGGDFNPPEGLLPPETAREIREAKNRLSEVQTEWEVLRKKLLALSVPPEDVERLSGGDSGALQETLTLKADRPGMVTQLSARKRSALEMGADLLQLVDYRKVYIEAEAPEVDIASILARATETIPIRIPGLDNREIEGKVVYFDTSIDSDIRKAHLVIEVDNVEGNILRDNMAATVGIPLEIRKDTVFVPEDSVLTDGFEKIVFLDEGEHFHRVAIVPGLRTFRSIEVLEGLQPDQKVVVMGGRILLMAVNLPKGGGDPHAGHSH
jgi:multidrug efflux pump subunit AcrA (membrane-fusion protein)